MYSDVHVCRNETLQATYKLAKENIGALSIDDRADSALTAVG